jgi:hypothetical protein
MRAVGLSANAASIAAVSSFAAIVVAVANLDKSAVNAAKKYETLGLAFRFAAKEGENVAKEFSDLVEFADRTPFETDKLVRYSIQLRNVTSGLFGTTEQIKEMSGALAKAQMLGKDEAFINSLGRIITAFQTGSGQIKRYTQTLLNSGAITVDTAKQIKELSKSGGTAQQVIKVLGQEFRRSKLAAFQFAQTAEGLESTLRSRREVSLAGLGNRDALENYKLILKELNSLMSAMRDTEAFKNLGQAIGDLNAEMFDLIKSDEFKQSILDTMVLIRHLTNLITNLVGAYNTLKNVPTPLDIHNPAAIFGKVKNFLGIGNVNEDLATFKASMADQEAKALKELVKSNNRTANTLDPEKTAEEK